MHDVAIRRGAGDDLPALTELYNHYVRETAITFDVEPFTLETRRPWFEQFAAQGRHQLFVAERGGRVLGYACAMRFRLKAAYLPSVETSVYLRPEAHGRGLGTRLYAALFGALAGEDVHRAYAGITLPNPASVALHARFGFRACGTFREVGRKFGSWWDVTWMEKKME
jgi:phosphinothricin acetyltransferase